MRARFRRRLPGGDRSPHTVVIVLCCLAFHAVASVGGSSLSTASLKSSSGTLATWTAVTCWRSDMPAPRGTRPAQPQAGTDRGTGTRFPSCLDVCFRAGFVRLSPSFGRGRGRSRESVVDPNATFSRFCGSVGEHRKPGFAALLQGRDGRASLCEKDAKRCKPPQNDVNPPKIYLKKLNKISFLWQHCPLIAGIESDSL